MSLRREELKYIDYRVPPELAHLILQFDGSILVDRTWGNVAGWCDAEAANVLGLHMVHALVTGKPSVEARHRGAEHRGYLGRDAVCRAAAVRGPPGRQRRPRWEHALWSGAPADGGQAQGRGHRRRGSGRSSHAGLPHGVQVGVATSPRDSNLASVAAVPLSAARLGVI